VIRGSPELRISARHLHVVHLLAYRTDVSPVVGRLFPPRRALVDPSVAAVIADTRMTIIVNHRRVVCVVDHRYVYIVHRPVVIKVIVFPTPAFIAVAEVAESIVDSAVETLLPSPQ